MRAAFFGEGEVRGPTYGERRTGVTPFRRESIRRVAKRRDNPRDQRRRSGRDQVLRADGSSIGSRSDADIDK